jgi:2-phosphosulfolactate phosphatase
MSQIVPTSLEVLLTPAEFEGLPSRDLSDAACVVFDVLRATTSMVTALGNGAEAIYPVVAIDEAVAMHRRDSGLLLAGEREGLRIRKELTGDADFDLGNSPREFTREKVCGKTVVMTTTNGTRALRACAAAQTVLVGAFLNLGRLADCLRHERPKHLILVCSGTHEEAAYEDTLAAGALCEAIWERYEGGHIADSAQMARAIYLGAKADLLAAVTAHSRNGRRLLAMPELREDVALCLQRGTVQFVAALGKDGAVRRL